MTGVPQRRQGRSARPYTQCVCPRRVSPVVTWPGCSSECRIIRRASGRCRAGRRRGPASTASARAGSRSRPPRGCRCRRGSSGPAAPRRAAGRGRAAGFATARSSSHVGPRTSGPRCPTTSSSRAVSTSSSTGMRSAYAVGPSVSSTSRTSSSKLRGRRLPRPDDLPGASISKWVCSVRPPREPGEHVLAVRVEGEHLAAGQVGGRVLRDAEVGAHDGVPDERARPSASPPWDAVTLRHPSMSGLGVGRAVREHGRADRWCCAGEHGVQAAAARTPGGREEEHRGVPARAASSPKASEPTPTKTS